MYIQDVSLPDRQTLSGDSRHEDKHYKIGNHGEEMCSVGAMEHSSLRSKTSNDEKNG